VYDIIDIFQQDNTDKYNINNIQYIISYKIYTIIYNYNALGVDCTLMKWSENYKNKQIR